MCNGMSRAGSNLGSSLQGSQSPVSMKWFGGKNPNFQRKMKKRRPNSSSLLPIIGREDLPVTKIPVCGAVGQSLEARYWVLEFSKSISKLKQ
jgi:hypothetical protein